MADSDAGTTAHSCRWPGGHVVSMGGRVRVLAYLRHVGQVTLVDCIDDADDEFALPGSFHWQMRNAVEFETPVPVKGSLSLWLPPPAVLRRCRRQLVLAIA